MIDLAISIVIYKQKLNDFEPTLKSIFNFLKPRYVYIIDNSPTNDLFGELKKYPIEYIFTNDNIGFGAGHNIAIQKSIDERVKYHLVVNPDICFNDSVLQALIQKMDENSEIGLIMPQILNMDGSVQFLPKLLPTPFNLLIRVLSPLRKLLNNKNREYTLENYQDLELNVPIISGCFSLFRVDALKEIGLYDDSFFMYFEDFDISRRIHSKYKTLYFPKVSVFHEHERGAAKSFKLFRVFVKSAVVYFNKYGWFFDRGRIEINKKVLDNLK